MWKRSQWDPETHVSNIALICFRESTYSNSVGVGIYWNLCEHKNRNIPLHNGFQLKICILHPITFSNCIKHSNAYLKCSWISYYSLFCVAKKEKIEINYTSFVCHLIFICKLVWAISALSNAALNFLLNFWLNYIDFKIRGERKKFETLN